MYTSLVEATPAVASGVTPSSSCASLRAVSMLESMCVYIALVGLFLALVCLFCRSLLSPKALRAVSMLESVCVCIALVGLFLALVGLFCRSLLSPKALRYFSFLESSLRG